MERLWSSCGAVVERGGMRWNAAECGGMYPPLYSNPLSYNMQLSVTYIVSDSFLNSVI